MAYFEAGTEVPDRSDPGKFRSDILNYRPRIPHGFADISELEVAAIGYVPTEAGWAWERTVLFEATASEAYRGVGTQEIVTLDVHSSTPIYTGYLRFNEFIRDGARARDLVKAVYSDEAVRTLRDDIGFLRSIARAASRDESRALIEGAVQEFLYTLTPEDLNSPKGSYMPLARQLCAKLLGQQHVYSETREGTHVEGSRGLYIEQSDLRDYDAAAFTYPMRLARSLRIPTIEALEARQRLRLDNHSELPPNLFTMEPQDDRELAQRTQAVGERAIEYFIAWQARTLAQLIIADPVKYKPARHLSMDYADPKDIALSGLINMPEAARSRPIYTHAVRSLFDPYQHIQANMFEELPFPDNSLTLITLFDGWPAHFQTDPDIHGEDADMGQVVLDTLLHLYRKLAYGGKIVISPWGTFRTDHRDAKADEKVLDAVLTEFSTRTGQHAHIARASRATFEDWMSVADRQLAEVSPIFKLRGDSVNSLVINKPKESSYKSALKTSRRRKQIVLPGSS